MELNGVFLGKLCLINGEGTQIYTVEGLFNVDNGDVSIVLIELMWLKQ